ncbi:helix-turn-helix transcriptional regulator [bacterium]|nr:helix-turn-helix transcriptional regulator [bacterium]
MQWKSKKSEKLIQTLGKIIREERKKRYDKSLTLFAYEFDLNPGNLCKIENSQIEPKITMLWRIAEALDMPLSDLIKLLEQNLGEDFNLIEK